MFSLGNSLDYNHMPLHRSPEVEEVVAAQVVEGAAMIATVAVIDTTHINEVLFLTGNEKGEGTASGLNYY